MTAATTAKNFIRKHQCLLSIILAFAIPVVARTIPELLMGPFLVGFDSIGYYVPNTLLWLKHGVDFWSFLSSAPLIYLLLMGITSTSASIVIALKVLSPLLLGFVGLVVYLYAIKVLSWSYKKSLIVVPFATLYFVALRISWDMLRSELALIFLFLALILLHKPKLSKKNGVLLSFLMFLTSLTHQLIAVIMFAILIATLARLLWQRERIEFSKILAFSTPAIVTFLAILYANYLSSNSLIGFSKNFSSGFMSLSTASYAYLVVDTLGFLLFCYLPLVPLLVFAVKHFKSDFQLKIWLIWCINPLLLVVLIPFPLYIGGVLPYRWTMLLIYPLAFYAVAGLSRIRWNWYKIAVGVLLVILSASFLVLPNSEAFGYYHEYPSYIPTSMLQNTMQLSDCQDTVNALVWAKDNMPSNGYLLVHQAFYGWGTLNFDIDRLVYYGFGDPTGYAQQLQKTYPSDAFYLIWWVNGTGWYGQTNVNGSFNELYHSGNIAIYKYSQ